jgi:hypothetical protein
MRLGKKLSTATIDKLRLASVGENNTFFGKIHTEDSLAKMSLLKKGSLNPMYGKNKSAAFKFFMGCTNGSDNPNYKPIFVWDIENKIQLGPFGSKSILSMFHISGPKYYEYLDSGLSYKGYYYSRKPFTSPPDNNSK